MIWLIDLIFTVIPGWFDHAYTTRQVWLYLIGKAKLADHPYWEEGDEL